ncbi:helix-turn-helix transcriptional regulator [Rhizobium sp. BK251]|uniref:helix-turn-helix domain-containing protein n=1 Tax=Rhizobium sp. BK251 TaxID=2512125 RepID=UPI0010451B19|nr:helix-turn-helix transcriptional regulator [Rhizobium sp. BK251]TCL75695.1 helix-turn-helix protein [Rhizobium sp. BK251]
MSISLNNFQHAVPVAGVGSRVKAAREAVGYSIEDLAVTCGLAIPEISAIEDGSDADPTRLKRIAAALQLPLSALLGADV